MPSPKKCSKFPKGSKAYKNCISYGGTKTQGGNKGISPSAEKKRRKAYGEE